MPVAPTEYGVLSGDWRLTGKPYIDDSVSLPTVSEALKQLPRRMPPPIRAAPNMDEHPTLKSEAEAFKTQQLLCVSHLARAFVGCAIAAALRLRL